VRRLAVLGSPIGHSKSPVLHAAAYAALDLPWEYAAIEVDEGSLGSFLSTLDDSWRGLSLTMPLKREILPFLDTRSGLVDEVGAANTVVIEAGPSGGLSLHGYITDVGGITGALGDHGVERVSTAHLIGTGATAATALVAAAHLGAEQVLVTGRRAEALEELSALGALLGIRVQTRGVGEGMPFRSELVIDTLPAGVDPADDPAVDDGDVLLDVSYDPWPTPRAARWLDRGGIVVGGLEMLLHQAIGQVRIFTTGSPYGELRNEAAVIRAMRHAVERS
jgi:shikimate dehydrogenase